MFWSGVRTNWILNFPIPSMDHGRPHPTVYMTELLDNKSHVDYLLATNINVDIMTVIIVLLHSSLQSSPS